MSTVYVIIFLNQYMSLNFQGMLIFQYLLCKRVDCCGEVPYVLCVLCPLILRTSYPFRTSASILAIITFLAAARNNGKAVILHRV